MLQLSNGVQVLARGRNRTILDRCDLSELQASLNGMTCYGHGNCSLRNTLLTPDSEGQVRVTLQDLLEIDQRVSQGLPGFDKVSHVVVRKKMPPAV